MEVHKFFRYLIILINVALQSHWTLSHSEASPRIWTCVTDPLARTCVGSGQSPDSLVPSQKNQIFPPIFLDGKETSPQTSQTPSLLRGNRCGHARLVPRVHELPLRTEK